MRKIVPFILLLLSIPSFAQKTWSFYGNVGVGFSKAVTLEGLQLPEEDMQYFRSRGITPNIMTEGKTSAVPAFMVGASYYFDMFRVSVEMGSQYVNQSNYHARNFITDAMFGYSPLKGDHELNVDLGLGYYALRNNYIYNWKGVDANGKQLYENGIPEQRTIYLGNHDVNTLSIPLKLSYLYNFYGKHWVGAYVQGRYNFASEAFCPESAVSAGIEYRFTLGKSKKKTAPKVVTRTKYVYVEKTQYLFVSRPVEEVAKPEAPKRRILSEDILFEINSPELTGTARNILNSLDLKDVTVIELIASTCSRGTDRKNDELGHLRLKGVTDYIRGLGYEGEIISGISHNASPDPDWRSVFIKIIRD